MIVITGGAGYIGSHIAYSLRNSDRHCGVPILLLDDLTNTEESQVSRVLERVPKTLHLRLALESLSAEEMTTLFRCMGVTAVVHCAGLKDGPASLREPLSYFGRNLSSTWVLGQVCKTLDLPLVFSSSASVYASRSGQVRETDAVGPSTPYAYSKLMAEQVVQSIARAVSLRYFNPIGSQFPTWGEAWSKSPASVAYYLCQASVSKEVFTVHGSDYPTVDGSPIRDFIAVQDLADAHVAVLDQLMDRVSLPRAMNVGTGTGHTIRELVTAYRTVAPLRVSLGYRRPGDIAVSVASPDLIRSTTDWYAKVPLVKSLREALASYLWAQKYKEENAETPLTNV